MKDFIRKMRKKEAYKHSSVDSVRYVLSYDEKRTVLTKSNVGKLQEAFVKELQKE